MAIWPSFEGVRRAPEVARKLRITPTHRNTPGDIPDAMVAANVAMNSQQSAQRVKQMEWKREVVWPLCVCVFELAPAVGDR
jgi:hypothetical protein